MISQKNYTVTLLNEKKGIQQTLEINADEYILDIAEESSLNLPYSCRAGACFDCLGKVVEGKVVQTEKALEFLRPDELAQGYILLCACSPRSNCTILTHQVEELFGEE
ncbi:ferredoxin [Aphanothece hegewaldii CCALA 016]|uniref:Ferredoxin n=1 Tax=Aphanothece hegewaldii CCALA 016 TaxID=2107694 RepID=A0A2T1M0K8_9CHRO|nr:2Fe-2S iron-sulfur cluster-binding protein [Aphanothece hegewaldii]PSF38206.1 ferredoxin [Aphanothece hegewaldii CCALA 016]